MKKIYLYLAGLLLCFTAKTQWTVDSLSAARSSAPVAVFNSRMLVGSTAGNAWDLFDMNSGAHTSGVLSLGRTEIQFTQTPAKAYFAGGKYGYFTDPVYTKNIDVYTASTNTWSVLNLSLARIVGAAGTVGNKVIFAGGIGRDFGGPVYLYNRVDIFNANTGVRTTAKLSKARTNIATGTVANKIFFAGGWFWDVNYNQVQSNVIDIYDNLTGAWSATKLSSKRESMGVAVVNNKILFAGGFSYRTSTSISNAIDVYDATANAWSVIYMNKPRYNMSVAVVGSKAYFAGGVGAENSIDVYDATTNTCSLVTMPAGLTGFKAVVQGDNIYFAGGYDPATYAVSDLVQVYNTTSGTWTQLYLSQARFFAGGASTSNKIMFAGGAYGSYTYPVYSNRVDIYTNPMAAATSTSFTKAATEAAWHISPNPATDYINLYFDKPTQQETVLRIVNADGITVLTHKVPANNIQYKIPVQSLQAGIYFLQAEGINNSIRFLKR